MADAATDIHGIGAKAVSATNMEDKMRKNPNSYSNQYNLTQDEQDELDAFLVELDTQAKLEESYEEEYYTNLLEEELS